MSLTKGDQVPQVPVTSTTGEAVTLDQYKGKYVVLYFYPKDMTPGCTTEACDFRDHHEQFQELDAVILGVSPDPVKRHESFINKHELPFELLADEENELAEAFGTWKLKKNFGKEYMGIERSTFLIDPEGTIIEEWRKVKVKGHVEEALQHLRSLVS
ncbi:thioredoxin-dependent thiol peroxidase [Salisediminibacterium selenitireducens]|uniref:thioredoxin-dependent peroxiredoxin n=1 Tax=Bacillus selenitireducens (strain ATCC 700615 / DSM 15326 / MLS10) TaxID=439292 RepID=D6XYE9_BACIE|nr:thioredoxin-dependent thiol peroxidase [Salisediminibacterium selenitireducens]ADI00218.1 alkyl hydroperoxide reductase/ Thiol specific antioxidant/ Mal allergen [[Bacillus] selenitireducens MLS10]